MFAREALTYTTLPLPDRVDLTDEEMRTAASEFYDVMRKRHTVRDYTDQPVPRDIIERCIKTAGTAPSGANHQPWHFVAVANPALKQRIREEAEEEERRFYEGGAGDEWIKALEPIGTNAVKEHLTIAPWLIIVFAQRWGQFEDGTRYKNYYVPESVNIATGFLLAALHHAGLSTLTHTPNPMRFLNEALGRPASEKPTMIIAVGHPAPDATVPQVAKMKKPMDQIATILE
ncbi:nitroreductase family protein [Phaeobacter gallaeciensis]|uniref:Nitroreductase family protein n=2 Tax=Roseobacteraceae TaxID=2854170 RepID=A0A366X2B2_9RHOB|nr:MULTISPECIES: nitroreductase family protein [Roseobacteraceae]MBT3139427.1 nitroreductase family protein [Falsiruegeria litorea]MBT8166971.1 nitroreductase family protein [Falsiruegeria litorea]RBW57374.1 nitroreductase family protein [Phaeobacter gallaeciensis]